MHQGDSLVGPLFVLAHFHALQFSMTIFPFCKFFLSFANDTHIIGLVFIVHFSFNHFVSQLVFVGFVVHPCKCLAWVLFNMPFGFSPPINFVVLQTTLGFWVSHLGLLLFFFFSL
jgi:hypothetical protein